VIGFELSDARSFLEKEMRVQMITCGYVGYLDYFPGVDYFEIPIYPVTGVTKVEYFATDAAVYSELASSKYIFDDSRIPPRVYLAPGESWPDTDDRVNAVKVTFNAGFNTASDVPETWKRAVKLALTNFHEHRGDEGLVTLPKTIYDLINPDTLYSV
jgi:uncharacterized phiE125 gp8 family phage protein